MAIANSFYSPHKTLFGSDFIKLTRPTTPNLAGENDRLKLKPLAAERTLSDLLKITEINSPTVCVVQLAKELAHGIAANTKCGGCQYIKVTLDDQPDYLSGTTRYMARATCSAKGIPCPDHAFATSVGMPSIPPMYSIPEIPETPKTAPGFPSDFECPYTGESRDKPSTALGEIW